ncbi:MAG: glycosyltransferase [Thermomicrobiales bacterium]
MARWGERAWSLGLAGCAAVALRQWWRVRRTYAELGPPEPGPAALGTPQVAIVLPVRNEAAKIDGVVTSLLAQDCPAFDLLVVDDGSTDQTPALLAAWARRDPRMRVRRVEQLPPGWAGKPHALHTGAAETTADWLLFTDADTRHAPSVLRLVLGHALRGGLDLVSAIPHLTLTGAGTRLLTPIGAISLLERATPAEVRDPGHRGAFAVGQYILIRRAAYQRVGGYAAPELRTTFADDVRLAEVVKRAGGRVDVVSGHGLVFNEQWTTWGTVWRGWRKSIYGEVGDRPFAGLAGGLLLLGYGLLPLVALARVRRGRVAAALGGLAAVAQVAARWPFDRDGELAVGWSLTAPVGWAALGALVLDATRLALTGRGADWKGRAAPHPVTQPGHK